MVKLANLVPYAHSQHEISKNLLLQLHVYDIVDIISLLLGNKSKKKSI